MFERFLAQHCFSVELHKNRQINAYIYYSFHSEKTVVPKTGDNQASMKYKKARKIENVPTINKD